MQFKIKRLVRKSRGGRIPQKPLSRYVYDHSVANRVMFSVKVCVDTLTGETLLKYAMFVPIIFLVATWFRLGPKSFVDAAYTPTFSP